MNLQDFYDAIPVESRVCRWCGKPLSNHVDRYNHGDGWKVDGFEERQWLSVRCSNPKCRYEWSLWKVGVPRDLGDNE